MADNEEEIVDGEADVNAEAEPVTEPSSRPESSGSRTAIVLALVSLMLSIVLIVAGYFGWNQIQQLGTHQGKAEDRIGERLSPLRASLDQASSQQNKLSGRLDGLKRDAEDQLKHFQSAQKDLDHRVGAVATLVGRSQHGWSLAEVEYLLRIANQRVRLQRDVASALKALASADDRLRELADPDYLAVRQQISRELVLLEAVPSVDVAGLSVSLTTAIEAVERIPVNGSRYPQEETQAATEVATNTTSNWTVDSWRELPGMLWGLVSNLFQIREHDAPLGPMLVPEQEYFLRENLRLQLAAARLALLREDAVQYQAALSTSRQWMQEHFSDEDETIKDLISSMDNLLAVNIVPVLPDIGASLKLLHQQIKSNAKR